MAAVAIVTLTDEQLQELLEKAAERGAERALARGGAAPDVLSTADAARLARVTAKTIRVWIAEGLPASKGRGGRITIRREDLDAWRAGSPPKAAAMLRSLTPSGS